jgi:spore coat protein CotH
LFASLHLNAQSGRQLFDNKTVGEIRIKVDARNWSDQLDSMRIYGGGLMEASVIIDGKSYQGAGIRFRGDKSYTTGLKRNPFQIKLDYKNPGQQHQGYSTVIIVGCRSRPQYDQGSTVSRNSSQIYAGFKNRIYQTVCQ